MVNDVEYHTLEAFRCPLHMIRPRFKNNVENVLLYMAKEISDCGESIDDSVLDAMIASFPGNSQLAEKTLANWRTEISALFGLRQYHEDYGYYPSKIAKRLAATEDLIEFFKNFVIKMQFPCGMLKSDVNKLLIENNIDFVPFKFVIRLLDVLSQNDKNMAYLTKDELTYVIFDDVRFTGNQLSVNDAADIITHNRNNKIKYKPHPYEKGSTKASKGDQTRTALDFLDYMAFANILSKKSQKFYLNRLEKPFIDYAVGTVKRYEGFLPFYAVDEFKPSDISQHKYSWFDYVNELNFDKSRTNVDTFIRSKRAEKGDDLAIDTEDSCIDISTKAIGDMGEAIVIAHEKKKLQNLGLGHNTHLVKFIPTHLGAGYDVKSMDEMDNQIFIEVKTTLSNHPITQNRISLTKNEWNAAYTNRENYYIYRLIINNDIRKLLVLQNPVDLVRQEKIKLSAPKGVELIFNMNTVEEVEILA